MVRKGHLLFPIDICQSRTNLSTIGLNYGHGQGRVEGKDKGKGWGSGQG
jgi:hypothetical protein